MLDKVERNWLRRRFIIHVSVVVLILVLVLFHRSWWGGFTHWRAAKLLHQSEEYAAQGNWEEVARTAKSSLRLAGSFEGLRWLFKAQRAGGDPSRLHTGTALFTHPAATLLDRSEVMTMVIDDGDLLLAAKFFNALGPVVHSDPALHLQKVRFHLALGDWKLAVALADASEATPSHRAELDLVLAKGLARSGQLAVRPEVARRLATVLEQPGKDPALQVMRLLVSLPDHWIPNSLVEPALQRLEGEVGLSERDALGVALLQAGLSSANREEVVTETISRYRDDNLPSLAHWLRRLREWERLVDLTDPAKHPDGLDLVTFGARTDALGALGQLDLLARELEHAPAEFPEPLLFASRAALARTRGEGTQAVLFWQKALALADRRRDTNFFYRLSIIARKADVKAWEMEAVAKAIEHPLGTPPVAEKLDGLFAWLYQEEETERLLALSYKLLRRQPGNPILLNNYHYLQALHDQPREDSIEVLEQLVQAFPKDLSFRGSLAFVQLRSGDPEAALQTLDGLGPSPVELEAPSRAVYCAALHALERPSAASRLAQNLDWSQISDRERALLQRQLRDQ